MSKLDKQFYTRPATTDIAKQLLGKKLHATMNGQHTSGIICETEAYCGIEDRGCHAYNGRYTDRTKIMYSEGGVAYVYLCYGVHYLFNIITHLADSPHAILIRAIEPIDGVEHMLQRLQKITLTQQSAAGPGLVSQCMGFTTSHTGTSLIGNVIWVEDVGATFNKSQIIESARVGMNFEGKYKLIPWRFRIKNSPYTSKAK